VDKLKVRLDFNETFAPIVKWPTICIVVVIASKNHWDIKHLDVKTTFLNKNLKEEFNLY
jgi:hypothetical protein